MKKLLLTTLAILSPVAFADEASTERARELMQVMKVTENLEQALSMTSQFSDQMIDSQQLDAAAKAEAKKLTEASMKTAFDEMLKIDWEGMFAEIYGEVFTVEEVQGLIDFYKSPVGQKFVSKQTALSQATMNRMQGEMAKMMPKVQQATMDAIAKAKAKAENKASE